MPVGRRMHRNNGRNTQSPCRMVSGRRNADDSIQTVNQGNGVLVIVRLGSPWEVMNREALGVPFFVFQRDEVCIDRLKDWSPILKLDVPAEPSMRPWRSSSPCNPDLRTLADRSQQGRPLEAFSRVRDEVRGAGEVLL